VISAARKATTRCPIRAMIGRRWAAKGSKEAAKGVARRSEESVA